MSWEPRQLSLTVNRLWAGDLSVSQQSLELLLFKKPPHELLGPLNLIFVKYQGFFPLGVKGLGCEVLHSLPHTPKIKNE